MRRLTPRTSTPLKRKVPSVGTVSPDIRLSRVDFPQPLGPTMVTNSPLAMVSDAFSTATRGRSALPANRLVSSMTSNMPLVGGSAFLLRREVFVRDDGFPWNVVLQQTGRFQEFYMGIDRVFRDAPARIDRMACI